MAPAARARRGSARAGTGGLARARCRQGPSCRLLQEQSFDRGDQGRPHLGARIAQVAGQDGPGLHVAEGDERAADALPFSRPAFREPGAERVVDPLVVKLPPGLGELGASRPLPSPRSGRAPAHRPRRSGPAGCRSHPATSSAGAAMRCSLMRSKDRSSSGLDQAVPRPEMADERLLGRPGFCRDVGKRRPFPRPGEVRALRRIEQVRPASALRSALVRPWCIGVLRSRHFALPIVTRNIRGRKSADQAHLKRRRRDRPHPAHQAQDPRHVRPASRDRPGRTSMLRQAPGPRCRRRAPGRHRRTGRRRSDIRWAWASIATSGSNGSARPYEAAVAGMNCAMPLAPAGETASGLKLDSARSCAARTLAGTFQRDEARAIGARKRAGTNEGRPAWEPCRRLPAGRHAISGSGARRRSADVAVVPCLPRVALDEAEALRVRRQPAIGARRPEVELGAAAMERGARTGDHPRVRVRGAKSAACSASERNAELMASA